MGDSETWTKRNQLENVTVSDSDPSPALSLPDWHWQWYGSGIMTHPEESSRLRVGRPSQAVVRMNWRMPLRVILTGKR
jgi:hypothetical protein